MMWLLFHNHTHPPWRSLVRSHHVALSAVLRVEDAIHRRTIVPRSFKVLSVGVGRHGDVDDEGRLVLDAPVLAVGEGSHLHAVRVGLPQRLRGEQHSLQVLVPQGKGQRDVLVHHYEGGPGVHHAVLRVGHQPDQVLVGRDAEGKRQQLVLQRIGAQRTLQVVRWAVLQAEPTQHIAAYTRFTSEPNSTKQRFY